jgi:hypothetical protein
MAIESNDGSLTITGPDIMLFHHMRIASALGLEVNTGMKMSSTGSTMKLAAGICGSTKRTKRAVLADYVAWMAATYPDYRPAPSIVKALGKQA